MYLSIATTHQPATDLGYLLMKHPERVHSVDLSFGTATVFFPNASNECCEVVLTIDVDPVGLVRGKGSSAGPLDQYVSDRPYAASSFLAVAINRGFRTAMSGMSKDRPDLAAREIPLSITICPLPVPAGIDLVHRLFEPLGWQVSAVPIEASKYVTLTLSGERRLADALSHLYVLIPALDDQKHYWVGDDEVEKLLTKGGPWLSGHPECETIARRYLKMRRDLTSAALSRLLGDEGDGQDTYTPRSPRLNDVRTDAVIEQLVACGAKSVADLGCGEGRLLSLLARDRRFEKLFGLDASTRSLATAKEKLRIDQPGGPDSQRLILLHGALTYRDLRWSEAGAAVLMEVIEHIDADRLPAVEASVFGVARPKHVIVTTPNAEFNALYPGLADGAHRHADHRFEWTRAEFRAWAKSIGERFGYGVAYREIGEPHEVLGSATQMAVFSR